MKTRSILTVSAMLLVLETAPLLATGVYTDTLQYGLDGYVGVADTYVGTGDSNENFNYGAAATLYVFNRSKDRMALVRFDLQHLAGKIDTVVSAKLVMTAAVKRSDNLAKVRPLTAANAAWEAGAGSSAGAIETGAACWNWLAYNTVTWTTTGGDFYDSGTAPMALGPLVSSNITAALDTPTDFVFSGDLSFLKDWADGTSANAGFALYYDFESVGNLLFHSSEAATASYRPMLVLVYEATGSAGTVITIR